MLVGGGTDITEKFRGGCPPQAEADGRVFVTELGSLRVVLTFQEQGELNEHDEQ